MSEKVVSVEGAEEIIASFRGAGSLLHRETEKWFRNLSNYAVKQAQINILNQGAVDTNELIQELHYEMTTSANSVESVVKPSEKADKYAYWVDKGSPPHWVPISALIGWASRHDANPYAVQAAIAANGTRERPFWEKTWESTKSEVNNTQDDFVENILRQL